MSLENDFLAKLIDSGDYDVVLDSQITARHLSGRYKRAFKFIQDFKQKYAKIISRKEFERKSIKGMDLGWGKKSHQKTSQLNNIMF